MIQGTFNILYDFCVVLIPIPIVLRLNLPLQQRVIVALLFGVGFVVCFAGVVRTYYMYKVTDGYHDVTWDADPVWLGTAVELYLGIVSLSLSSVCKHVRVRGMLMKRRSARQHHQRNLSSLAMSRDSSPRLEAKT